jgi:hypothetical protein
VGGSVGSTKGLPSQGPNTGVGGLSIARNFQKPPLAPGQIGLRTMSGGPLLAANPFLDVIRQRQFWNKK